MESTIHFTGPAFVVGSFRCGPASELWRTENITGILPTVVFPRTAVEIHQADRAPVVATPNHAMLYNQQHPYRRDLIDNRGDHCEFFGVTPRLMEETLQALGAQAPRDPSRPFFHSHTLCEPDVYLAQRRLFREVSTRPALDPIYVSETFFDLLTRLLRGAIERLKPFGRKPRHRDAVRRDQVEAAKDFIARHFRERLTIESIAEVVECSVYHLCRIFRSHTGQTIHDFVSQYRLRSALEQVIDSDQSLTTIALDHCYSSHSHFTNAFRSRFGLSPDQLRKLIRGDV